MEKELKSILNQLKELKKYDMEIGGGCECCGSFIEHEESIYGDWVEFSDLEKIIKSIEETLTEGRATID